MKVRESGMPNEEMWSDFFNPENVLSVFGIDKRIVDIVEFGCGYGTFTLQAAKMVIGTVYALDIDPEMVETVRRKSCEEGVKNIRVLLRDFISEGTGLPGNSMDAALLFNILHHEEPIALMTEAYRVLKPSGGLAVIHWNHDASTPRGPAMEIRPRMEQCIEWGRKAGFLFSNVNRYDLPPYHYGLLFTKPLSAN